MFASCLTKLKMDNKNGMKDINTSNKESIHGILGKYGIVQIQIT